MIEKHQSVLDDIVTACEKIKGLPDVMVPEKQRLVSQLVRVHNRLVVKHPTGAEFISENTEECVDCGSPGFTNWESAGGVPLCHPCVNARLG